MAAHRLETTTTTDPAVAAEATQLLLHPSCPRLHIPTLSPNPMPMRAATLALGRLYRLKNSLHRRGTAGPSTAGIMLQVQGRGTGLDLDLCKVSTVSKDDTTIDPADLDHHLTETETAMAAAAAARMAMMTEHRDPERETDTVRMARLDRLDRL